MDLIFSRFKGNFGPRLASIVTQAGIASYDEAPSDVMARLRGIAKDMFEKPKSLPNFIHLTDGFLTFFDTAHCSELRHSSTVLIDETVKMFVSSGAPSAEIDKGLAFFRDRLGRSVIGAPDTFFRNELYCLGLKLVRSEQFSEGQKFFQSVVEALGVQAEQIRSKSVPASSSIRVVGALVQCISDDSRLIAPGVAQLFCYLLTIPPRAPYGPNIAAIFKGDVSSYNSGLEALQACAIEAVGQIATACSKDPAQFQAALLFPVSMVNSLTANLIGTGEHKPVHLEEGISLINGLGPLLILERPRFTPRAILQRFLPKLVAE